MSTATAHAPAQAPAAGDKSSSRARRRGLTPLWLLSPAGLVLAAVTLAPIGFLVFTSFTNYNQRTLFTGAYRSVGLDQYATLLPMFERVLGPEHPQTLAARQNLAYWTGRAAS